MKEIVYTKTYEQTQELGEKIAKEIHKQKVIALHGDLGSGKTTFIQGFAKGLGLKRKVNSPTFIIMRTYELPKKEHAKRHHFYHVDLYRIEDEKGIEGIGLLDIMNDTKNIVAIEWPEKIDTILPKSTLHIYFTYIDENTRMIEMTPNEEINL